MCLYIARRYTSDCKNGYLSENVIVEAFAFSFVISLLEYFLTSFSSVIKKATTKKRKIYG